MRKITLLNGTMIYRLLRCLYIAGAIAKDVSDWLLQIAAVTRYVHCCHVTYAKSKLNYGLSARSDISCRGNFHLYRPADEMSARC